MTRTDGKTPIEDRFSRLERWAHWTVLLPVATHLTLLVLDVYDRAVYQYVGVGTPLHSMASSSLWNLAHLVIVGLLLFCRRPPGIVWAHQASAGTLALWGGINLAIGWTFEQRVTLLGPALVILLALAVLGLAFYWSDRETPR